MYSDRYGNQAREISISYLYLTYPFYHHFVCDLKPKCNLDGYCINNSFDNCLHDTSAKI